VRQCWNTNGKRGTIASLAVFLRGRFVVMSLQDATRGMVEEWASESLLAAREAYQNPMTGARLKPGAKLGREYFEKSLPVVRERLYRAGVRLVNVLNECFE
jgi:hypothetical protein